MLSGYGGRIAVFDLGAGSVETIPSEKYVKRFIGGRGLAAALYWDLGNGLSHYDSPDNCLIFASGPVAGFSGIAGGRWVMCSKTPLGESDGFNNCNLGGKWGIALKSLGYDALVVKGKSDSPVYLLISDDQFKLLDATAFWGKTTFEMTESMKEQHGKSASVAMIGPAGESEVAFASVVTDNGSTGSGGMGPVMGVKNLKAVVVLGNQNKHVPADQEQFNILRQSMREIKSKVYAFSPWRPAGESKQQVCAGCGLGCDRVSYALDDGRRYKSLCQAAFFYLGASNAYYGAGTNNHLFGTRKADGLGMDTAVLQPIIEFVYACYKEGIISEKETGLPLSEFGSIEFIETLLTQIAYRQGFGALFSRGIIHASKSLGKRSEDLLSDSVATKTAETKDYDPRMTNTTALFYATEPRRPIQLLHEVSRIQKLWLIWAAGDETAVCSSEDLIETARLFWGGTEAADFTTINGKALAAKLLQDRNCVKESLVLCDRIWASFPGGKPFDTDMETRVYNALTGNNVSEAELMAMGERIFNLQRAIYLREGWHGRQDDTILDYYHEKPLKRNELFFNAEGLVPGKNGEIISKVGAILERDDFEKMKDDYYQIRNWDNNGFPTRESLDALALGDIAQVICPEPFGSQGRI